MTARVARVMPPFPRLGRHYIGKAYTASLAAAHVDFVAHMGGYQLSHCLEAIFGDTESTAATYRFLVRAGANTRAVAVCIVPMGFTGSNPSITIAAAEGETVKTVRQDVAGVADLGDVMDPGHFKWSVPVTAGALNEITVVTNNVRLHSACAYEVPRAELRGTEVHVDRSLADPARYLTDNATGSDPRGATEMANIAYRLRTNQRRHLFNLPCRPGLASVGAGPDYLIGSAAAANGPRILARDVRGGATTTIPTRCKVRVDSLGAGTWTITFIFPGGVNASIAGVNATGWWPRAGGELVDPGASGEAAFVDRLKVTATRTAGAGIVTCDSFFVAEDA